MILQYNSISPPFLTSVHYVQRISWHISSTCFMNNIFSILQNQGEHGIPGHLYLKRSHFKLCQTLISELGMETSSMPADLGIQHGQI